MKPDLCCVPDSLSQGSEPCTKSAQRMHRGESTCGRLIKL